MVVSTPKYVSLCILCTLVRKLYQYKKLLRTLGTRLLPLRHSNLRSSALLHTAPKHHRESNLEVEYVTAETSPPFMAHLRHRRRLTESHRLYPDLTPVAAAASDSGLCACPTCPRPLWLSQASFKGISPKVTCLKRRHPEKGEDAHRRSTRSTCGRRKTATQITTTISAITRISTCEATKNKGSSSRAGQEKQKWRRSYKEQKLQDPQSTLAPTTTWHEAMWLANTRLASAVRGPTIWPTGPDRTGRVCKYDALWAL